MNPIDPHFWNPVVTTDLFDGTGRPNDPLRPSEELIAMQNFFAGATIDTVQGNITSNGTTVVAEVEKVGGGDFKYKAIGAIVTFPATPAATVNLVPGTDTVPVLNFIYIDVDTNSLAVSTTGFPLTVPFVPLATALIPSAAFVQVSGTYKVHRWDDHLYGSTAGHLQHLNAWIRNQHATWVSGIEPTFSGSGTAIVNVGFSSGGMFQLHEHPTVAVASPADLYVVDDSVTPFRMTNNLASITADAFGNSLANKYFAVVIWFAYSELPGDSKFYVNLPTGSYNSESDARADSQKYANFGIPAAFKGTGILIHRAVCRLQSGNLTLYPGVGDDLRGALPNTAAGSSSVVVTGDHGTLTGLADDDHPQYLTQARGDLLYEPLGGGTSKNLDGGFANAVYLPSQNVDGGSA